MQEDVIMIWMWDRYTISHIYIYIYISTLSLNLCGMIVINPRAKEPICLPEVPISAVSRVAKVLPPTSGNGGRAEVEGFFFGMTNGLKWFSACNVVDPLCHETACNGLKWFSCHVFASLCHENDVLAVAGCIFCPVDFVKERHDYMFFVQASSLLNFRYLFC